MKLVRSNINEKFTEDSDTIKDLGIGRQRIINELASLGIKEDDLEFKPDGTFFLKKAWNRIPDKFIDIQMKYFPDGKSQLMKDLRDGKKDDLKTIKDAHKAGVSIDDIIYIVKYLEPNEASQKNMITQIDLYSKFLNRTSDQKKFDKEYNIYVFIGYDEKLPVEINGKKYYEDKFEAEKMVKMNKYDLRDLHSVDMMKSRAMFGRHGVVYMVSIPKFMMDEQYYEGIPEEWRDIVDKYKKKI
jgi:hypothetical protein